MVEKFQNFRINEKIWFWKSCPKILEYRCRCDNSKNTAFLLARGKILEIFNLKCNYIQKIRKWLNLNGRFWLNGRNYRRNEAKRNFWSSKYTRKCIWLIFECGRKNPKFSYWKILVLKRLSKNPKKNLRHRFWRAHSKI